MTEHMLEVAVGALITLAIGFLWNYTINYQKSRNTEVDALKKGLQSLLRYKIIDTYEHYTEQGWIPLYALQGITACYNSYEKLGENGVITHIFETLNELPNHPPEEELKKEGEKAPCVNCLKKADNIA